MGAGGGSEGGELVVTLRRAGGAVATRTIALDACLAPPGADQALFHNTKQAKLIDVEESEFVLMANEVRMLNVGVGPEKA